MDNQAYSSPVMASSSSSCFKFSDNIPYMIE
jgi:hypothetical protein